jgi:hypothetical protein
VRRPPGKTAACALAGGMAGEAGFGRLVDLRFIAATNRDLEKAIR